MTDAPDPDPAADGESPADAAPGADVGAEGDDADDAVGLVEARERAIQGAKTVLEHEFEGVVRVERRDDGWRALVEVVERSAVPDTQDIIGRYEVELDRTGTLTGYGLVERYRRGDMKEEL